MQCLQLTRTCINNSSFIRINVLRLLSENVTASLSQNTSSISTYRNSRNKNVDSEADTFGNVSKTTEEQRLKKWVRYFNKSQRYEGDKSIESNREGEDESNLFGLLNPSRRTNIEDYEGDEGDKMDEIAARRRPVTWKTASNYGDQMKKLVEEKKLGEALLLYKKMIKVDLVKPNEYVYRVLISGCARAGFTSMAFELYKTFKERGLKMHSAIVSSLFNSCGNTPFPEYGLKQARYLYDSLTEKEFALNIQNYNAAIKAFGRCGDLQMAFRLVDEMIRKELMVGTETFNFLLMSCASDKNTGLLEAIQVWKKMKSKRVKPDIYSYNLLLRVTRDGNIGDLEIAEKILLENQKSDFQKRLGSTNLLNAGPPSAVSGQLLDSSDLLLPNNKLEMITGLNKPKTPQDRLMLLGGMHGVLDKMAQDRVKPNLKTFTELLELIPSDAAVESDLLTSMKIAKVSPDIDFYNVLIKKRNFRSDYFGARAVLDLVAADKLYPDIATFGTLATGCTSREKAWEFLEDLEKAGFRPNIQIVGALVQTACFHKDFFYVIDMLKFISKQEITPDRKLINILEKCVFRTKGYLARKEKDGLRFGPDDPFIKSFEEFLKFYKPWLQNSAIEMPDDPWATYRIPKDEDDVTK